jgi:hypothetical protein
MYFTIPTNGSSAADIDRILHMADDQATSTIYWQESAGSKGQLLWHMRVSELWVFFDPDDLSGASYGCLNKDCRRIIAVRLTPISYFALG